METIRDAAAADLDAVLAIYGREALEGYATFDTRPPAPAPWAERIAGPDPFLLATDGAEVVGMAYATTFRPRPAYDGARSTSIYLVPGRTGRGLGTTLYTALLDRLRAEGRVRTAIADVALPNEPSLRLHARLGYVPVGTLREVGDKFGRLIDVAMLQLML